MADIRIKDLAVTAGSSASDDYLAVDGSTNGTRKLSAYSPTFGGAVTSSGNLTTGGDVILSTNNTFLKGKTSGGSSVNLLSLTADATNITRFIAGVDAGGFQWTNQAQSSAWLALNSSGLYVTSNLTVSGGTITSGSGTLTLNSSANTVVLQSAGTTALTLDVNQDATFAGKVWAGNLATAFTLSSNVSSGADRNIFAAQVSGASNGLQVKWNHATTTLRINISSLPTSSSGLTSGDLWNDGGTLKIV